jgi:tripartite-type tricarboxylate transporter receptor subunit TctC
MVHGKKPSGQAWNAWKAFMIAGFGVQKAMWLPEQTKPEIIEAYRDAAKKVIADPEFQVVVEKSLGGYQQMAGENARKAFDQVLSVPKEDKAWVVKWIKDEYDIEVK